MEKILILDNYDSFTYNIVYLINELGYETEVFRNDRITVEEVGKYERIVLSRDRVFRRKQVFCRK